MSALVRHAWWDALVRTRMRLDGGVVVSLPLPYGWAFNYVAGCVTTVMGRRYSVHAFARHGARLRLVLRPGPGISFDPVAALVA